MVSLPMCLRFGRLLIENSAHFNKITAPNVRLRSSVSYNQWNTNSDSNVWFSQKQMSTAATEEQSKSDHSLGQTTSPENATDVKNLSEKSPEEQIKILTQEVQNLTKKSEELTDKYMRALADGENLRKRLTKQIEDTRLFCIQGFCKDLLEVADILSKATECVPKEEVSDSNPHLKNLYEGLNLTERELKNVFKRHGLVAVNPLNEKFDPNVHEALFQQEVEGKEAGTVVVVSKIGYTIHDRVVRPALVGVAKAP